MDSVLFRATLATSLVALATTATADEFDYEIRVGYAATDTKQEFGFATIPPTGGGVLVLDTDGDTLALSGSWFYDGLSDAKGPRTRAQFLDRASALTATLSFGESDGTSIEIRPGDPLFQPQLMSTRNTSDDEFGFSVQHVWRDAGVFVNAAVSRQESDTQATSVFGGQFPPSTANFDADSTSYTVGAGYYVAQNTAVSLSYTRLDSDVNFVSNIDVDIWSIGLTHVAELTADWHYAVDATIARTEFDFSDSDSYAVAASLLPGNDVEFGIGLAREAPEFGGDVDTQRVFGRWFIRNNVALEAELTRIDPGDFGADTDIVSVGVNARF